MEVTISCLIGTDDAERLILNFNVGSEETESQRIAREWREKQ